MSRANELIQRLGLRPHPEGGHYWEFIRSEDAVRRMTDGAERGALTQIFFLLRQGEFSAWHRIHYEEVWQFVEGAPLELFDVDLESGKASSVQLGPVTDGRSLWHLIPSEHWQAARSTGEYTLVTCTVAPAFEPEDLRLLASKDPEWPDLQRLVPEAAELLLP